MPIGAEAVLRVEQALRPLDEVRRVALRAVAARGPFGRALVARRSVRVPLLLSLHAFGALGLAVLAPSLLIVIGPLVLGVPHVAADVRHLLARRGWPRWWLVACGGFALALVLLRVLAEAGSRRVSLPIEHGVASAWVLVGAAGGAAAASSRAHRGPPACGAIGARLRAAIVVAAAVMLGVFGVTAPRSCRLALLHGHNLAALVVWLALFRRGRLLAVPVVLAITVGALLASGALLGLTLRHGALSIGGLHLFAAADWLAPGLSDSQAIAIATSFAFLQSIHYAVWLIAIPSGDRPGDGGRSWRGAFRDLVRDLTPAGLLAALVLTVLVAGLGVVCAANTRRLFLSLATFHVWLELAVLAYVLARGGAAPAVTAAPPSPT